MPDALHLHLRPCEIAVIRYHEQDNELVELRFRIGQEREARFALTHISAYDPDYNAIFSSRFRKITKETAPCRKIHNNPQITLYYAAI
mgnify:CR=1 FL=1